MKKFIILIAVMALMGCGMKSTPMTVEQMVSNCEDLPADDQCGPFPIEGYCQGLASAVSGKSFKSAKECRLACEDYANTHKSQMVMIQCADYLDSAASWCTEYCNQNF